MKVFLFTLLFTGMACAQSSTSLVDLLSINRYISIKEQAAPGTPPSGSFYIYPKTDGKLYTKNDSGTESELAVAGASGVTRIVSGTGLTFTPSGTISTVGTIGIANTAVSAGSYSSADITVDAQGRLTAATNASSGYYTKYTFTVADFNAAATSETRNLHLLPVRGFIEDIVIKHNTAFSGGGAITATLSVGDTANGTNFFVDSYDVFQAVGASVFFDSTPFTQIYSFSSTQQLTVTLTSNVNVSALTAGSVSVYIKIGQLATP